MPARAFHETASDRCHSGLAGQYAGLLDATAPAGVLCEPELFPELPPEPDELEWQSRWFAGDFGRDFVTLDGRKVRIVQFGWWNQGAGPDFRDCAVEIGGTLNRGSIELDREARDWEAHGHAENPDYNDTVLHLLLTPRSGGALFTRTAENREVPQVVLTSPQSFTDDPPPPARPGRCSHSLRRLPESEVLEILKAAARYRLECKGRRWRTVAEIHGYDQAIFQGFAEALGYSRNKLPMTVLAQRLPLKLLLSRTGDAEALLYGAAGFLEGPALDHADAETRIYLRGMWEAWWKCRGEFAPGGWRRPVAWKLSGLRPVNHPQRRLAALWQIVVKWKSLRRRLDPDTFAEKALTESLETLRHPHWDHHFTLTSKPSAKRMALLGAPRITDMLANVVYPLLVAEREAWWSSYCQLRAADDNDKVRRAALRLFGTDSRAATFTEKVWQHQALLQIYADFCLEDATDCAGCPFPEQMTSGAGVPPVAEPGLDAESDA